MKPMLAGKVKSDLSGIAYPTLASLKLDGIRCLIVNGVPVTRSLKPIKNDHIRSTLADLMLEGFDGELIVGDPADPQCYQKTHSAVMKQTGTPDFTYYAFDMIIDDTTYSDRLLTLRELSEAVSVVRYVDQVVIDNEEELVAYEEAALADGHEGVMIRCQQGQYKYGRSTTKEGLLLKLKRFSTSEAVITGVNELMTNLNPVKTSLTGHTERSTHKENLIPAGVLGAFEVADTKTGIKFKIGTGLDAKQRETYWVDRATLIDSVIKYSYFPVGIKNKPRFPVFLGFRDKDDMK